MIGLVSVRRLVELTASFDPVENIAEHTSALLGRGFVAAEDPIVEEPLAGAIGCDLPRFDRFSRERLLEVWRAIWAGI